MKKLIVLFMLLLLTGCSVPAGEAGADGSSGIGGENGRDYVTPVIRPYTWDTSGTSVVFSDIAGSNIQLSQIAMNLTNNNNYLLIKIPANNDGKKVQCVINGVASVEVLISDNSSHNLVFSTLIGIDYDWGKYLDCDPLDMIQSDTYLAWYVDGILQEYYFCDSFN